MRTYRIVGDREVAGKFAGDSLTEAELGEANIEALVVGGHIVETQTKAHKAAPSEE